MQTGDWQPEQYLRFRDERTQPAIDLAGRIGLTSPGRIIDIGCGPGNSTAVLRTRWPGADITGMDSSPNMIERAQTSDSGVRWLTRDVAGDLSDLGRYDIVFSNAALQWMPDHGELIHRLFGLLNPGGVLAVQVPFVRPLPVYAILLELAASPPWRRHFQALPPYPRHFPFTHYYEILSSLGARIQAWQTDYIHIMDGPDGIVQWYKGSGLRPFLELLPEDERPGFLRGYEEKIVDAYPRQGDGKVLFPFTRIFFTAQRIPQTGAEDER